MKSEAARALDLTDRKSLLALQGVGRESETESVRFHGRGVPKAGGKSNTCFGERSAARTVCLNELKAVNHQLAAHAPIDKIRP
jgi:hypothetical protein